MCWRPSMQIKIKDSRLWTTRIQGENHVCYGQCFLCNPEILWGREHYGFSRTGPGIPAAGLGYNTLLAAYQNSPEENPGLDYAEYVLLDTEAMRRLCRWLRYCWLPDSRCDPHFQPGGPIYPGLCLFLDFVEEIHNDRLTLPSVILSDEVSSAMSITNAWSPTWI